MNTGNAITIEHRAVWLNLMHDGGEWTPESLTLVWAPTFSIEEMRTILATLEKHGFVRRIEHRSRTTWSVTDDCAVMPGILQPRGRVAA